MQNVEVIVLEHGRGLPLPSFQTSGSSGVDLFAAVMKPESIAPGQRALIPTGLCVACPPGHEFQVRPRSGLALRHGVTCLNTPGTVDEDYRGEIKVILANLGNEPFEVVRGMRIAQMVLCPIRRFEWREVGELGETIRGEGGFGHTGHQAMEN